MPPPSASTLIHPLATSSGTLQSFATSLRPSTRAPTGSATQTEVVHEPLPEIGVLRLRGAHVPRQGIKWAEDVVDNEGLGRKSSKVCCIYHKPRAVGESSSEDDSSSSSSDDESDDAAARIANGKGKRRNCRHEDGHDCDRKNGEKREKRKQSPNAYEKMPKGGKSGG